MGKDLKGKELGVGISQRKDGYYTARFTNKRGERKQKYFKKLQECRRWIADAEFNDEHGCIEAGADMTVDAWFEFWLNELKASHIQDTTKQCYQSNYRNHIKIHIGKTILSEIKPFHCQNILNKMSETSKNSTIANVRMLLYSFFECAVDNDILSKNPVTKNVQCKSGQKSKEKRVLSLDEQRKFMEYAKRSTYYNQFALILQTGLRVGELSALQWNDVDFDTHMLHISHSLHYNTVKKTWIVSDTKTESGKREIPLTKEAEFILRQQKTKMNFLKIVPIEFIDFCFLTRNGRPIARESYDICLADMCKKLNIDNFSIHTLRHTFATRCLESGMKPKILQSILGHADIGMTMNTYVHVTEKEKTKEMLGVESGLLAI